MSHIIERFLIHFASSTFLTLAFYFLIHFLVSKYSGISNWVSSKKTHILVTSALVVFAFFTLREPYDTAFGTQPWYKAIFDQLSWFLGPIIAVWGLYRFDRD